jgi:hypothetical protein
MPSQWLYVPHYPDLIDCFANGHLLEGIMSQHIVEVLQDVETTSIGKSARKP